MNPRVLLESATEQQILDLRAAQWVGWMKRCNAAPNVSLKMDDYHSFDLTKEIEDPCQWHAGGFLRGVCG